MKKYCVLGAGLMGKAVAYDLLKQKDTDFVIIADNDTNKLKEAKRFLNSSKLKTKIINASNSIEIENIFRQVDAAVAAIHYELNYLFTKVAIKTKTHLCDLGGNSFIVDKQLKLNKEAKKAGISIIPDCGLAPGMVSVLVKWGVERFPWADSVKIRVGGLPQNPKNVIRYERLFSVDGLINEYVEPVRLLQNGKIKIVEPLIDIEEIAFPKPFNKLEAFTTSGGTSTLIKTYKDRFKNLDYKTIRYPGHASVMRAFYEMGFFTGETRKIAKKIFEETIPLCKNDVTLVKIIFQDKSKEYELVIIDKAKPPFTSMMRTTAFPAAIISKMQASGQLEKLGVNPQEACVKPGLFIQELKKRNIKVIGISI